MNTVKRVLTLIILFYLSVRAVPYYSESVEFIGVKDHSDNIAGSVYRAPFSAIFQVETQDGRIFQIEPNSYDFMVIRGSKQSATSRPLIKTLVSYLPLALILLLCLLFFISAIKNTSSRS